MIDKQKIEQDRKRRNAELTRKVKAGERIDPLVSQDATHFPPRPVIKKDKREMARIYGAEK